MRGYFGVPYHARIPVHPGAHQQIMTAWEKLQYFHQVNIDGI
jgi:hypothetical protein